MWTWAARLEDFGDRQVMGVTCGVHRVALYRLPDGVYATRDACPHLGGWLSDGEVVDGYIECPRHFALFDIRTGASDGSVTDMPVRTLPVRVDEGQVFVDLPEAGE